MLIAVLFAIWLPTFGLGGSDIDDLKSTRSRKGRKCFVAPTFASIVVRR